MKKQHLRSPGKQLNNGRSENNFGDRVKKELLLFKSIEKIIKDEGFSKFPYECTSGKLTIGYGRNLEDVGISEQEAIQLLSNDVISIINILPKYIKTFDSLKLVRKYVLVNMVYNLGLQGFLDFKKMIQFLERSNFKMAAQEMLDSKWKEQVGNRAIVLAKLMLDGKE